MSHRSITLLLATTLALCALTACQRSSSPTETSEGPGSGGTDGGCADLRTGRKNAYFGDLHTHTSFSLDAYFFNAVNDPRAAHEFAKGQPGGLPGLGTDDPYTKQREVTIGRPLDFNAVTDHAEFLGGFMNLCGRIAVTQQACDRLIGQGIRGDIVNIANGNTSLQQQMLQYMLQRLQQQMQQRLSLLHLRMQQADQQQSQSLLQYQEQA